MTGFADSTEEGRLQGIKNFRRTAMGWALHAHQGSKRALLMLNAPSEGRIVLSLAVSLEEKPQLYILSEGESNANQRVREIVGILDRHADVLRKGILMHPLDDVHSDVVKLLSASPPPNGFVPSVYREAIRRAEVIWAQLPDASITLLWSTVDGEELEVPEALELCRSDVLRCLLVPCDTEDDVDHLRGLIDEERE